VTAYPLQDDALSTGELDYINAGKEHESTGIEQQQTAMN
jgi:hypothetical protein